MVYSRKCSNKIPSLLEWLPILYYIAFQSCVTVLTFYYKYIITSKTIKWSSSNKAMYLISQFCTIVSSICRGAKVGGAEGALAPPIILVFTK